MKEDLTTEELIDLYKYESGAAFSSIPTSVIRLFYEMILGAYREERKVFACGNGGNVASAQNLVLDLNMHPFVSEDKSKLLTKRNHFYAVNLCSDPATITGMVNDIGFDNIFAQQLKYQGDPGDILFAMSGSGNSKNIIEALKQAKEIRMYTVLITRSENTKCEEFADLVLRINGISTFPGNTGGNNNNFHYEDCISKVSHIVVGLLKQYVQNET
jgi:D-sedoheptulose 7-phosphate isomerase